MLIVDGEMYRYPEHKPTSTADALVYVKRRVWKFFSKWDLVMWDASAQKFRQYDNAIVAWCDVRAETVNKGL